MSRIASRPVKVPKGVEVNIAGNTVKIKGSKGEMSFDFHPDLKIVHEDGQISFAAGGGSKFVKAMSGTTRALVQNMVTGVSDGFQKKLDIVGVGYRAEKKGNTLVLTVGYSHQVQYPEPAGVTLQQIFYDFDLQAAPFDRAQHAVEEVRVSLGGFDLRRTTPPNADVALSHQGYVVEDGRELLVGDAERSGRGNRLLRRRLFQLGV